MYNVVKVWLNEGAMMPVKATEKSIGYDVAVPTNEKIIIPSKGYGLVDTGIVVDFSQVEEPVALHLLPRSSLFKKTGLILANSMGLFEPDYCGKEDTVKMMFYNVTDKDVVLRGGMRIGQFYFAKIMIPDKFDMGVNRDNKNKDRGGIGSSGE